MSWLSVLLATMLWSKYKDLFITEQRIKDGIKFWQDNLKVLERAEQTYHVPAEVILPFSV